MGIETGCLCFRFHPMLAVAISISSTAHCTSGLLSSCMHRSYMLSDIAHSTPVQRWIHHMPPRPVACQVFLAPHHCCHHLALHHVLANCLGSSKAQRMPARVPNQDSFAQGCAHVNPTSALRLGLSWRRGCSGNDECGRLASSNLGHKRPVFAHHPPENSRHYRTMCRHQHS